MKGARTLVCASINKPPMISNKKMTGVSQNFLRLRRKRNNSANTDLEPDLEAGIAELVTLELLAHI
jgi:hypothetical protein